MAWPAQVYCTLQMLAGAEADGSDEAMQCIASMRPWGEEDRWLIAIVGRVLEGRTSGEEQSSVTFDRALATGGARRDHPALESPKPSLEGRTSGEEQRSVTFDRALATEGVRLVWWPGGGGSCISGLRLDTHRLNYDSTVSRRLL